MMSRKLYNRPAVVAALSLLCCALLGSAFPCVKLGYEWLDIEGAGSQILFAGYRFFLSGVFTFLIGCIVERRVLTMKRSSAWYIFRQGLLQTTIQYVCFYIGLAHTTGTKGSIINASQGFFALIAAHIMLRNEKIAKNGRMHTRACRRGRGESCTRGVGQRLYPGGRRHGADLYGCVCSQYGAAQTHIG